MREKGIDISSQRMKLLTPNMCSEVETIVVLCSPALCPDYLTKNKKVHWCEIQDPFEQDPRTVARIRDQIEQVVLKYIRKN